MKLNLKKRQMHSMVRFGVFVFFAAVTVSCNKTEDTSGRGALGPAKMTFKVGKTVFEDVKPIGGASARNKRGTEIQTVRTAIDKDFHLVSELIPSGRLGSSSASGSIGTRASVEEEMGDGFKYKVAIFDEAGRYINHRNYERNYEGGAAPIILDGGKRYTFVAYSLNNKQTLPEITFSDPANKTLSTATVSVNGTADLMYFSKSMIVSGEEENALDITFKHLFSQITVKIDGSAVGNVTWVNSWFTQHKPTARITMSDGAVTRSGTTTTSPVAFSSYGTPVVTSDPTMINAAANNNTEYGIYSLQIGGVTKNNLKITGLSVSPGVKYNLNVRVTKTPGTGPDEEIEWEGRPAVRIGNDIWMRHNVGADYTKDPDVLTESIHGNYFQFGRPSVIANNNSRYPFTWDPYYAATKSWNSGTEANPVKTTKDPCPSGYRVPTRSEMERLQSNTDHILVGRVFDSNTNYSLGAVLTSKQNRAVKLTLPAQGGFIRVTNPMIVPHSKPSKVSGRGSYTSYLTSSVGGFNTSHGLLEGVWRASFGDGDVGNISTYFKVYGNPVRCVGIQ
ncbi:fimbrillin family protein [Sphingobacterium kitahiroshimense]|uniref:Fimbrillin family protein n=1 Tax=Sphingobacterium kitahiroshimense TaxID=470446 RepID=A0ABV0BXC6_9SPHI